MKAGTFSIEHFTTEPNIVARTVRTNDVFSILTRSVPVPPDWIALVWGESSAPTLVPAGRSIEGDACRKLLFIKTTPFEINYEFTGLTSKDGFAANARIGLSVSVGPDRADAIAFQKAVMVGGDSLGVDRLREHCEPAIKQAVEAFTRAREAAELLSAAGAASFDEFLAERFRPLSFESGLVLASAARFETQSADYIESQSRGRAASLRQQRLDEDRQQRERDRAYRESHLAELSSALERLQAIASKNPDPNTVELIKTFSPTERGGLYHALLSRREGDASQTSTVLVVAGDEMVTIEPNSPEKPLGRQPLSSNLGPLRSIRPASLGVDTNFLVGARSGVHVVKGDGQEPRMYSFLPKHDLRGGVNAAAIGGNVLYATHSEVGLIRWALDAPVQFDLPLSDRLAGCKSVRDVQADAMGRIWLAADKQAMGLSVPSCEIVASLAAPANITSLLIADESVIAGLADGRIVRWHFGAFDSFETLRHACGRVVESLAWLEGGGAPRLLVGDRQPHLEMLVLGDSFSVEYRCAQPVRWGHATADWIVGVNDRRDQLILWRTESPHEPIRIVNIGQLCGHSIQDVGVS